MFSIGLDVLKMVGIKVSILRSTSIHYECHLWRAMCCGIYIKWFNKCGCRIGGLRCSQSGNWDGPRANVGVSPPVARATRARSVGRTIRRTGTLIGGLQCSQNGNWDGPRTSVGVSPPVARATRARSVGLNHTKDGNSYWRIAGWN